MSFALLITGTDTEVGKTFVGVGLIRAFVRLGLRVAPFKPVETGCLRDTATGTVIPADARLLQSASGTSASLDVICPYRFSLPAAPWVAAEKERRTIEQAVLDQALGKLRASHDGVLIESAGGLLAPLARDVNFCVLAKRWNVPVLVVAGSRLGVLNQTLLTVRHLEHEGVKTAGTVLNHPFGESGNTTLGPLHHAALDTNADVLKRMLDCPLWEVPFAASQSISSFDTLYDGIADSLIPVLRAST